MRILKKLFWYALATIFLIEAWLWDRSVAALHAIVDRLPLVRFKAACARGIRMSAAPGRAADLHPAGDRAAALQTGPCLGCWRRALSWRADWLSFVSCEIVSVGLAAFIFDLTRDKLLSMPWFARLYARVMSCATGPTPSSILTRSG